MLRKIWCLCLSLLMTVFVAEASEITDARYPGEPGDIIRDKLVGIYATFQLKEAVIRGCNRLHSNVSNDVADVFEAYGKLAQDYIEEGKRLLNEEMPAVEMMEWKASMANARKHYQQKFSQMPLPELKMECQQLATEMATVNRQVIALKSQ
ncbi:hypothetical protein [Photobacterium sp. J15]|uniref:hypothetical protein n=1 Tax=Photobacterium sp. J15 TaxID=265901 RepID=UPI000B12B666|nr:hypothetical protein [Photobacterium sp. J15]